MMTRLQNKTSRQTKLEHWLNAQFPGTLVEIKPLQNDASFRQYYRCTINGSSYVVMDAPPDKENIYSFIKMTEILSQASILVPELIAYDLEQGFMILSDFGDIWLLEQLKQATPTQVFAWYCKAIDSLLQMQQFSIRSDLEYMPPFFDANHIKLELSYFSEWFLKQVLQLALSSEQSDTINQVFKNLIDSALNEPQVLIHRDYHSRNLMVLPNLSLGTIDYQDAMIGPLSYDLASLLKDCYLVLPEEQRDQCLNYFYEQRCSLGLTPLVPLAAFKQAFDWIGLQRHLKVLGVFSRLKIRDNKPKYLDDMPRIMNYVAQVIRAYPQFSEFYALWQQVISPAFAVFQATREADICVP